MRIGYYLLLLILLSGCSQSEEVEIDSMKSFAIEARAALQASIDASQYVVQNTNSSVVDRLASQEITLQQEHIDLLSEYLSSYRRVADAVYEPNASSLVGLQGEVLDARYLTFVIRQKYFLQDIGSEVQNLTLSADESEIVDVITRDLSREIDTFHTTLTSSGLA